MFVDAAADIHFFRHRPSDLAADFLKTDSGEMAPFVRVCPFRENSTVTETKYVRACLEPLHPANVLLVTSDWHTARALSIFRKRLPQYHWSIGAANDPTSSMSSGGGIASGPRPPWWSGPKWRGGIVSIAGDKGSFEALLPVTGGGPVEASRQFSGPLGEGTHLAQSENFFPFWVPRLRRGWPRQAPGICHDKRLSP